MTRLRRSNVALTKLSSREAAPPVLLLPPTDARILLERWARAPTTPQGVVRRARIVLLALQGMRESEIARAVGVSRPTVKLWIGRFTALGPQGLLSDAPGRGRPASLQWASARVQLQAAGLLDAQGQPVNLRLASTFLGVSTASVWRAMKRMSARTAEPGSGTPPGAS